MSSVFNCVIRNVFTVTGIGGLSRDPFVNLNDYDMNLFNQILWVFIQRETNVLTLLISIVIFFIDWNRLIVIILTPVSSLCAWVGMEVCQTSLEFRSPRRLYMMINRVHFFNIDSACVNWSFSKENNAIVVLLCVVWYFVIYVVLCVSCWVITIETHSFCVLVTYDSIFCVKLIFHNIT